MSLKVYEMEHSPYCIPITQALIALGVEFNRVAVPNWDRNQVIELTKGQYYQVPALDHDGTIVIESSDQSLDIARYVDRVFAGGRLFPAETVGLQEIIVEHIESEVEGYTFRLCDIQYLPSIDNVVGRAMSIRHKERRFGRGCVDQWREEKEDLRVELNRLLSRFDCTLQHRDFLLGAEPQYVDFALLGVIGNYTYRDYNQLAPEHVALAKWVHRLEAYRFDQ